MTVKVLSTFFSERSGRLKRGAGDRPAVHAKFY